jgi:hypothetical protein
MYVYIYIHIYIHIYTYHRSHSMESVLTVYSNNVSPVFCITGISIRISGAGDAGETAATSTPFNAFFIEPLMMMMMMSSQVKLRHVGYKIYSLRVHIAHRHVLKKV